MRFMIAAFTAALLLAGGVHNAFADDLSSSSSSSSGGSSGSSSGGSSSCESGSSSGRSSSSSSSSGGSSGAANDSVSQYSNCFKLFGPFKLEFGAIDNTYGAGITGSYDKSWKVLDWMSTPAPKAGDKAHLDVTSTWESSFSVDSAWRSGSNNNNYATIVLQPQLFQTFDWYEPPAAWVQPAHCPADQYQWFTNPVYKDCIPPDSAHAHAIPIPSWSPNLDLEYRVGKIAQSGKTYNADQLVYGVGAHFFLPVQIDDVFAAPPYVTATYDRIVSSGDNNLPTPNGIQDRYLYTDAYGAFYIPHTELLSCHRWTASAKITGSHPTYGGGGWQVSRTFELIMQVGTSLKPAITYQSGTDRGLTYDHQTLFGIVWSFRDDKMDKNSSCDASSTKSKS